MQLGMNKVHTTHFNSVMLWAISPKKLPARVDFWRSQPVNHLPRIDQYL